VDSVTELVAASADHRPHRPRQPPHGVDVVGDQGQGLQPPTGISLRAASSLSRGPRRPVRLSCPAGHRGRPVPDLCGDYLQLAGCPYGRQR